MFSKANKPKVETPPVTVNKRIPPSIVAEDMEMVGNIVSKGDVQLDGKIEGDITSNKLTVGEKAVITGTIFGDEVRIAGSVNGEITARKVELTSTARVTGDINHDSLSVQAGAYVQGLCTRVEMDKLQSRAAAAPAAGNAEPQKPKPVNPQQPAPAPAAQAQTQAAPVQAAPAQARSAAAEPARPESADNRPPQPVRKPEPTR